MSDRATNPIRRGAVVRRQMQDRGPTREFLAFKLGGEAYGIEISQIGAILKLPPLTPVPRAPDNVMGIVSVRGRILVVVDIRRRLRLPENPRTSQSRILVLPTQGRDDVGLFVEEVLQVYRLHTDEIEPAGPALGADAAEHVIGIGRQNNTLIILIDIGPILAR